MGYTVVAVGIILLCGLGLCHYFLGAAWLAPFVALSVAVVLLAALLLVAAHRLCVKPLAALSVACRGVTADRQPLVMEAPAREFVEIEAALREAQRAFHHVQSLSLGVFRGLPMPYLCVDVQEKAIFLNQACLDMLEIDGPVEACLGKTLSELFYNDASRKTVVRDAIAEGKKFHNLDVTITGHKGRVIHVLANVFPLCGDDGACVGGLCLYIDMTALRQAQELIKDKNEKMLTVASSLEQVVEQCTSIARAVSDNLHAATNGAEEQSRNMAETSEAMREMNNAVMDVARNAADAFQVTSEARTKAHEGLDILSRMIGEIRSVQQRAGELTQNMDMLGTQAEGISSILEVISDIADQTNLLALNAAIEAARAGEAGRGFAVVADEVRKLAEKTMASTQEVGKALQGIQESARQNKAAVDVTTKNIASTADLARASGEALTGIVQLVDTSSDQVQIIATASEEQSATSEQITSAVGKVAHIAQETVERMEESEREVKDLMRQTSVLVELIGKMKI